VYEDQIPLGENQPIETNEGELNDLANKIKSVGVEWKPEQKIVEVIKEVIVEKEPEPKTEKEIREKKEKESENEFWKRRNLEVG